MQPTLDTSAKRRLDTLVRLLGAAGLLVATITLLLASYRLVVPEAGLPPMAARYLSESPFVLQVVRVLLVGWIAASLCLGAASFALIARRAWGVRLSWIWVWIAIGGEATALVISAVAVGSASVRDATTGDALLVSLLAPGAGCCPLVYALTLGFVLASWGRTMGVHEDRRRRPEVQD